jgi:hypothetical protein
MSADNEQALRFKKRLSDMAEDAAYIARWGDGNCGYMIEELMRTLVESGLYDEKRKPYKSKKFIPGKLAFEIMDRDGNACLHCGSFEDLTIDHRFPESLGGTLDKENLQTLCRRCNSIKGVSEG